MYVGIPSHPVRRTDDPASTVQLKTRDEILNPINSFRSSSLNHSVFFLDSQSIQLLLLVESYRDRLERYPPIPSFAGFRNCVCLLFTLRVEIERETAA